MTGIVIVGASLAGVTAAGELRAEGHDGPITVIGDEAVGAYARPPLSKAVLAGQDHADSVILPGLPDDVEVRLGVRAVGLDASKQRVLLDDATSLRYDGLVVATGSRARRLPDSGRPGQLVLRTLEDCLLLRNRLAERPTVLIVGAGFLGLEIASTCRDLGLDVTIVDREAPLRRVLGPTLGDLVADAARDHGVRLHVAVGGGELIVDDRVRGVRTADGHELVADLVISAIGDLPNVEWLAGSPFESRGPLLVDGRCRLVPGVVAAGDVCAVQDGRGLATRTPHWHSAIAQARTAARALLHGDDAAPFAQVPYVWTEGHGLEVKICGTLAPGVEPGVLEGSLAERSAVLQWAVDGEPVAAASVNRRIPVGRLRRLAGPSRPPLDPPLTAARGVGA
jgi:NADPH-dependent 2,4-dienoyl-CoA reductase/sulfur reductase-like enzyme